MNFFKLYIGDYLRDTGTLTLAQHGAYLLMMLEAYATEKPLPSGRELHRLLRADSKAERDAIDHVAAKFWQACEGGLANQRVLKEWSKAGDVSTTNRVIALDREAKKRARKEHEACTNRGESVARNEHHQTPDTRHQRNTKTPPYPPAGGGERGLPAGFEDFWGSYPRKTARANALKAYAKLRPDESLRATILAALAVQSASDQWRRDGGQFIPHAATWINGRRWEDSSTGSAAQKLKAWEGAE